MKGFLKRFVAKVTKGQGGFTLIEMIVVVGIIAVLAAVIVPNIGKFIGAGEQGARDAEKEAVQTAMNAMMAEESLTAVDATNINAIQDWTDEPGTGAQELLSYLQLLTPDTSTEYFYCWNASGLITKQDTSAVAC
jgi:type IV pilus assembly protein PilA